MYLQYFLVPIQNLLVLTSFSCIICGMNSNPLEMAIAIYPSLAAFAEAVGVRSYSVVQQWRKNGVPIKYCSVIERVTAGKVTRQDLRPDDWMDIWPELVPDRAA